MIIYILELENNKYYIGKTNNISDRILSHFNENGSSWTKRYHPIKVIETIENCDSFEEDRQTKIYMKKYGIENVRGGSYCQIKLSDEQIRCIKKELNTCNDTCFECNETGHFINDCPNKSDFIIISKVDVKKPNIINTFINNVNNYFNIKIPEIDYCYRCGRDSHDIKDCYAKYHEDGYKL